MTMSAEMEMSSRILVEPVEACFGCTAANLEGARLIEQLDKARAEIESAYHRGAEAMRRDIAREIQCLVDLRVVVNASHVLAMPLPEVQHD